MYLRRFYAIGGVGLLLLAGLLLASTMWMPGFWSPPLSPTVNQSTTLAHDVSSSVSDPETAFNPPLHNATTGLGGAQQEPNMVDHFLCSLSIVGMFVIDPCAGYMFLLNGIETTFNELLYKGNIVTTTPPEYTWANQNLLDFMKYRSLYLANVMLMVVVAWACLRHILGKTFSSWHSYADFLEILPRLVLGILAANLSLYFCQWVISISNHVSVLFDATQFLKSDNHDYLGKSTFLMVVVRTLFLMLEFSLFVEAAARYTLLYVLIAFSPLWLFAMALRETAKFAKAGAKSFILLVFVQPTQMATLSLGGYIADGMVEGSDAMSIFTALVVLGILLVTVLIFVSMLGHSDFLGGMATPFVNEVRKHASVVNRTALKQARKPAGFLFGPVLRPAAHVLNKAKDVIATPVKAFGDAYRRNVVERGTVGILNNLSKGLLGDLNSRVVTPPPAYPWFTSGAPEAEKQIHADSVKEPIGAKGPKDKVRKLIEENIHREEDPYKRKKEEENAGGYIHNIARYRIRAFKGYWSDFNGFNKKFDNMREGRAFVDNYKLTERKKVGATK